MPVETLPVDAPPVEAPAPRRILGGRRLLVALLAALLVPGALVVAAVTYDRPDPPPTTSALRHPSLPQVPDGVAQAQLDRSAAAGRSPAGSTRRG